MSSPPVPVHGERALAFGETLVVADLHVGIERTLAMRGFRIPSGTAGMVGRLVALKGRRLIILGDLKDQLAVTSEGLGRELALVAEELASAFSEVVLIRGNHDGGLPGPIGRRICVLPASGMPLGGCHLLHGHARPAPEALTRRTLVVGHTHPRVALAEEVGRVATEECWCRFPMRRGAFNGGKAREVLVMPAFNTLCGGAPVNVTGERLLGPLLSDEAIVRAKGRVYLLDGTCLGEVGALMIQRARRRRGNRSYWDAVERVRK